MQVDLLGAHALGQWFSTWVNFAFQRTLGKVREIFDCEERVCCWHLVGRV